jgi:hypothetical protein
LLEPQDATLVSLELPTMLSAGGGALVMAIIEHLTATECRIRSVNPFEVGESAEFTVVIRGASPLPLRGTIATCRPSGPRKIYTIQLETSTIEGIAIGQAVKKVQTRVAAKSQDPPSDNGLTRASVRIPVDFALTYTQVGSGPRDAQATNISTGGMLMNCTDSLQIGLNIHLRFMLGQEVVSVRGRIVAHQSMSPNYNIAFYDVPAQTTDAIARYVASHL